MAQKSQTTPKFPIAFGLVVGGAISWVTRDSPPDTRFKALLGGVASTFVMSYLDYRREVRRSGLSGLGASHRRGRRRLRA